MKNRSTPIATLLLCASHLVMFALLYLNGGGENTDVLVAMGALDSQLVLESDQGWRLMSAGFLHVGVEHLVVNLIVLIWIGSALERTLGSIHLLALYFSANLIAASVSLHIGGGGLSAGSSGAICGLLGATVVLALRGSLQRSYWLPILVPLAILSITYGLIETDVDGWCHVGGLLAGMAWTGVLTLSPAASPRYAVN